MKKIKAVLYCTKAKPYLYNDKFIYEIDNYERTYLSEEKRPFLNGTIVAECDFEVEEIKPCISPIDKKPYAYMTRELERWELVEHGCLSFEQLDDYLKGKNGYAIHIKNLHIFDKPRELKDCYITIEEITWANLVCDSCMDFKANCKECYAHYLTRELRKAPQNMCNVWFDCERYILILIKPEWLCKILNGEQTILIKKQVLNCMKGNK